MFRNYQNYEVYDDGRIWSYSRNKFLKPAIDKDGYQVVTLIDNEGKKKSYRVHRVVYESVTSEPILEGMQINHIDERKDNNMRSNLELVTPKENCNYGTRNERMVKAKSKQVGAFQNDELVMTFQSTMEAERNGFHHRAVSACCSGKRKTHKGYIWKYINEKET